LNTTQANKFKELEKENTPLKRFVADLSLDNAILKEVLSRKGSAPSQPEQVQPCAPDHALVFLDDAHDLEDIHYESYQGAKTPQGCPLGNHNL
jgi:hypothetical protein